MYACSPTDEEIDNSPTTIYDRIEASPNYSILNYALQKTGLSRVLDGADVYTLFAPSDMVMSSFLNENGFSSVDDVPVEVLKNILLNHVVAEQLRYSSLKQDIKILRL